MSLTEARLLEIYADLTGDDFAAIEQNRGSILVDMRLIEATDKWEHAANAIQWWNCWQEGRTAKDWVKSARQMMGCTNFPLVVEITDPDVVIDILELAEEFSIDHGRLVEIAIKHSFPKLRKLIDV